MPVKNRLNREKQDYSNVLTCSVAEVMRAGVDSLRTGLYSRTSSRYGRTRRSMRRVKLLAWRRMFMVKASKSPYLIMNRSHDLRHPGLERRIFRRLQEWRHLGGHTVHVRVDGRGVLRDEG